MLVFRAIFQMAFVAEAGIELAELGEEALLSSGEVRSGLQSIRGYAGRAADILQQGARNIARSGASEISERLAARAQQFEHLYEAVGQQESAIHEGLAQQVSRTSSILPGVIGAGVSGLLSGAGLLYGAWRHDRRRDRRRTPKPRTIPKTPKEKSQKGLGHFHGPHLVFERIPDVDYPTMAKRYRSYKNISKRRSKRRRYAPARFRSNLRTGGYLAVEKKFVDYEVTGAAIVQTVNAATINPAGAVACLTATAQGDGENQRDGRQEKALSLHVAGTVTFLSQSAATPRDKNYVRVIIFLDTQTNGAGAASDDVLDPNVVTGVNRVHAFRNLQYVSRFRVLRDFYVRCPNNEPVWNGTTTLSAAAQVPFAVHIPLKHSVHHTGTTAAIANIQDNSIHLMAIATGGNVNMDYSSRYRFIG
jgi:hypothetical protein